MLGPVSNTCNLQDLTSAKGPNCLCHAGDGIIRKACGERNAGGEVEEYWDLYDLGSVTAAVHCRYVLVQAYLWICLHT